jgi:hypothetical protein
MGDSGKGKESEGRKRKTDIYKRRKSTIIIFGPPLTP